MSNPKFSAIILSLVASLAARSGFGGVRRESAAQRLAAATKRRSASKKAPRKKSAKRRKPAISGMGWKAGLVILLLLVAGIAYLDAVVIKRFSGSKWALPAKVYARPLGLYAGQDLSPVWLQEELRALGYQQVGTTEKLRPGSFLVAGNEIRLSTRGFAFWDGAEPARLLQLDFRGDVLTRVRGRQQGDLALVRLEPLQIGGIYPAHQEDRLLVKLDDAPAGLLEALVLVEDRRFYSHHGISPRAIARAMWANFRSGRVVQGGSTLTQQLVKNFFLSGEKSLTRKALEAVMALILEFHFDKADILEAYLNEVYLGQSGTRAIHGFGLASQYYFHRPLNELSLPQYALLVALVKGPSYYDPWRHAERATERRNLVIRQLAEEGVVSAAEAQQALAAPLGIGSREQRSRARYPAYLDLVRRQLQRDYREEDLNSKGLKIYTNFDPIVQWQAESSLAQKLEQLELSYGLQGLSESAELQGGVVITHAETGEVLAVVGGRRPRFAGFNRALDAHRPVGSLIKPAVYLTALEEGDFTLASMISDGPVQVEARDGTIWEPLNFDKQDHGDVPLHWALAKSYNQATARLGMTVGLAKIAATLKRLGVDREVPEIPSIILGSLEMSPFDIAGMYQTIAAGGFETPLKAIREITEARGQLLRRYPYSVEQRFNPQVIHLLLFALQEVMREGTGRAAYQYLPQDLALAGKTGTTDDLRDSWFVGFSGDRLGVVWLGRDDNSPTPLTGSSGALQVWAQMMSIGERQSLIFTRPQGVEYHWIDDKSGLLSAAGCQYARKLPFIVGTEPSQKAPCIARKSPLRRWWDKHF